jgi:hypothetical protein
MIADQRTGNNSGPALAAELSFRYSAGMHFLAYIKKYFKEKNLSNNEGDTDTAE